MPGSGTRASPLRLSRLAIASLACGLLGAWLRIDYALVHHHLRHRATSDALLYLERAQALLQRGAVADLAATIWPPGTSALWALLSAVDPSQQLAAAWNAGASILVMLLTAASAGLLAGSRAGWIALAIAALHPGFIHYAGFGLAEQPFQLAIAVALFLTLSALVRLEADLPPPEQPRAPDKRAGAAAASGAASGTGAALDAGVLGPSGFGASSLAGSGGAETLGASEGAAASSSVTSDASGEDTHAEHYIRAEVVSAQEARRAARKGQLAPPSPGGGSAVGKWFGRFTAESEPPPAPASTAGGRSGFLGRSKGGAAQSSAPLAARRSAFADRRGGDVLGRVGRNGVGSSMEPGAAGASGRPRMDIAREPRGGLSFRAGKRTEPSAEAREAWKGGLDPSRPAGDLVDPAASDAERDRSALEAELAQGKEVTNAAGRADRVAGASQAPVADDTQPGGASSGDHTQPGGGISTHDHNQPGGAAGSRNHAEQADTASSRDHAQPRGTASSRDHAQPSSAAASRDHAQPGSTSSRRDHAQPGSAAASDDDTQPGGAASSRDHTQPPDAASSGDHTRPGSAASSRDHAPPTSSADVDAAARSAFHSGPPMPDAAPHSSELAAGRAALDGTAPSKADSGFSPDSADAASGADAGETRELAVVPARRRSPHALAGTASLCVAGAAIGCAWGLATLFRPNALPVAGLGTVALLLFSRRSIPSRAVLVALGAGLSACLILAAAAHRCTETADGHFCLVSNNVAMNVALGQAGPVYGLEFRDTRHPERTTAWISPALVQHGYQGMAEVPASVYDAPAIWSWVADRFARDPAAYVIRAVGNAFDLFDLYYWPDEFGRYSERSALVLRQAWTAAVLLPALFALFALGRRAFGPPIDREPVRPAAIFVIGSLAGLLLAAALSLGEARYRIPFDGLLIALASATYARADRWHSPAFIPADALAAKRWALWLQALGISFGLVIGLTHPGVNLGLLLPQRAQPLPGRGRDDWAKASMFATPFPTGAAWNAPGTHVWKCNPDCGELQIRFGSRRRARRVRVSVDHNDRYRLVFYRGGSALAYADVAPAMNAPPGLQNALVEVPKPARGGFDAIGVQPLYGDGAYSIGELRPE